MKITRTLLSSLLIAAILAPSAYANQEGTSTATFLRIGQGARAEGMGGAFTAVADDAYATHWNPAGLAQITRRVLGLNHLQFIEDISSQHASLVLPFNKSKGSLGFSGTFVDYGSIERRDGTGATVSGDTDVTAYNGAVSWGQAFGDRMALGVSGKFINQDLAGETGSGFAADLGILGFVIPNKVALGATALNVGPKIKTGTIDENIPQTFTAGLAYYVLPRQLTVATDLEKERDSDAKLHLGFEYLFQGQFILRGGYQDTQESGGGLSAGAGFVWRPGESSTNGFFEKQDVKQGTAEGFEVRFDYAYVDYGDFDATHRIGVHLSF